MRDRYGARPPADRTCLVDLLRADQDSVEKSRHVPRELLVALEPIIGPAQLCQRSTSSSRLSIKSSPARSPWNVRRESARSQSREVRNWALTPSALRAHTEMLTAELSR